MQQEQELKIKQDTLTPAGANGQQEQELQVKTEAAEGQGEGQEENEKVELFLSSVKSKETKEKYSSYLKKYIEITGLDEKNFYHETNARLIERQIIDFVNRMKKKGMSYTAIKNYTTAVFSFYKINDIVLNTHKIAKFMPENRKVKNDRAYTHEEIAKLLEIADERSRVIILLLASSGMRVGAITSLKIRNLDANHNFNKITIYENTGEQYFSFITPECKKAVDAYLDMRRRYGEKINSESPLIREQFDVRNPFAISKPRTVSSEGLQWILRDLATRYNVISNRDIPIAHGFRYFWMTQAVNSELNPEIKEMLLGHKIGLASAYYRPTPDKMYAEYEKGIDNFTIDPANKLQRKLDILGVEKTDYEKLDAKIDALARKFYENNVTVGAPEGEPGARPMTEKEIQQELYHNRMKRKLRRQSEKRLIAELEKEKEK
jgi:integrase